MKKTAISSWNLSGGLASFEKDSLEFQVDAATPSAGLEHLVVRGNQLPGSLLAISVGRKGDAPLPAANEVYSRRGDLISVHEASEDWPVRTLLSWSALPLISVEGVLVVLTLSLQTDRPDVRPVIELRSTLSSTASLTKDHATYAWLTAEEPPVKGTACFIAPHPSDLSEATLMVESDECRLRLAPIFLEKGVIRRCRVAACFLMNGKDEKPKDESALPALTEFADQPLPLAT